MKKKRDLSIAYEHLQRLIENKMMLKDGDIFNGYDVGKYLKTATGDPNITGGDVLPTFTARTRREPARFGYYLEPLADATGVVAPDGKKQARYVFRRYVAPQPELPKGPGRPPFRDTEWSRLAEQIASIELTLGQAKATMARLRSEEAENKGTLIKK